VRVLLFLASVIMLTACAEDVGKPMNAGLDKTPVQLERLRREAAAGDCDSAMQLSGYYGYFLFDYAQERAWLEKAAAMHCKNAIISLGDLLEDSDSPKERRRGRALLKEASKLP
jgi:hypothetical protein